MNIGVLIPTRGDRPKFLQYALKQLSKQTFQPAFIEIVNDPPLSEKPDITYRYRMGCERLLKKGCDFILFLEDDDWYVDHYIEHMVIQWIQNKKPDLIGLYTTVYYNLNIRKYFKSLHTNHASMMSTGISAHAALRIQWGDDNFKFTDTVIWRQAFSKYLFSTSPDICIGIKHGVGMCGGIGHRETHREYKIADPDYSQLKSMVDIDAYEFYTSGLWK